MKIGRREYVIGQDRNEEKAVPHLYRGTFERVGDPMCVRGWNRLNGHGWSIFRNTEPESSVCRVCLRRANAKKPPVKERDRPTKWL